MNILEPGYVVPSRKTMTALLFEMQSERLMQELSAVEAVALTAVFGPLQQLTAILA